MNNVLNKVRQSNTIHEGQHIVFGLSGGPDSMCLFRCLLDLKDELCLTLYPVHVNHRIRPGDAEKDQAYVEDRCRSEGLSCRTFAFDCEAFAKEHGMTTEEAGRFARYEAFRTVAKEVAESGVEKNKVAIQVAHNADDQVETLLMRLIRGTGTDGLAAMEDVRTDEKSGFVVARPLLGIWRSEIEDFIAERGITPCMDETNYEAIYGRNKVRLELIPFLETYNPKVKESLLRLSRISRQDREYLEGEAAAGLAAIRKRSSSAAGVIPEDGREILLEGRILKELDPAVKTRVIRKALSGIGLSDDVSYSHVEAVLGLLESESPSAKADLPAGYAARMVYGDLLLSGSSGEDVSRAPAHSIFVRGIEELAGVNREERVKGTYADFDLNALEEAWGGDVVGKIRIRTREAGDYIGIRSGSGASGKGLKRKKLQDMFVDEKIPKHVRDGIYFAAVGSEILFIPAEEAAFPRGKYTSRYSVTDATKRVLTIEIFV